jgi:membrane protease YdiL (CAAX protease family)
MLSTFGMGVVWSLSAIYTKSLAGAIGSHLLVDTLNLPVFTFTNRYDPPSALGGHLW